jgi:DNA end-binding protein Ku
MGVKAAAAKPGWDEIVKGYEYEKGEYVALTDADFENANVKATHVMEITDFVDAAEISPIYYDRPYYLEPLKNAEKSYALLRDVLRRTGKVGIGKIVIRGRFLVVNLLRFPHELRDTGFDVPEKGLKIDGKELKMAERLVDNMKQKWNPEKYRDDYREDLKKHIENKIKTGETKVIDERPAKGQPGKRARVIDMMDLLKRSVDRARKTEDQPRRRKAS